MIYTRHSRPLAFTHIRVAFGYRFADFPEIYASATRVILNRLCNLEHWQEPRMAEAMRQVLAHFVELHPEFPHGYEHRKHWEFAQTMVGLEVLGKLNPTAKILSVAAGREPLVFWLTNHVRWVFATDIYGTGNFGDLEAERSMLFEPDKCSPIPFDRNRLVVEYMDALDLRFEEDTFDAVVSMSSIEHFGSVSGAIKALEEVKRVLKPGGVAAITTECIVNDADRWSAPYLDLFTENDLHHMTTAVPGLDPVEPIDFSISEESIATQQSLSGAIEAANQGITHYPCVVHSHEGRLYTSVSLFFRKVPERPLDRVREAVLRVRRPQTSVRFRRLVERFPRLAKQDHTGKT